MRGDDAVSRIDAVRPWRASIVGSISGTSAALDVDRASFPARGIVDVGAGIAYEASIESSSANAAAWNATTNHGPWRVDTAGDDNNVVAAQNSSSAANQTIGSDMWRVRDFSHE